MKYIIIANIIVSLLILYYLSGIRTHTNGHWIKSVLFAANMQIRMTFVNSYSNQIQLHDKE